MNIIKNFDLQLFADGAAAPGTGATGGNGEGSAAVAEATTETAAPTSKRKAKTDSLADLKFGIQPDTEDPEPTETEDSEPEKAEGNAEGNNDSKGTSSTAEADAGVRTYSEDEYKKGVSKEVKRRFKAMDPILRYASEALGVDIDDIQGMSKAADLARKQRYQDEAARTGNDVATIENNADNAYNVRNYKQELDSIREQEETRQKNIRWNREVAAAQAEYPEINIDNEMRTNPDVQRLVFGAGVPVATAISVVHRKSINAKIQADALKEATDKVTASVAAGANRPTEGGVANPSAQVISDPSKLTKEQRKEIKRRVARGEKIIW